MKKFKQIVYDLPQVFLGAADCERFAQAVFAPDAKWTGARPLGDFTGPRDILAGFYAPLRKAFPDLKKYDYILLSGEHKGEQWVAVAGYYVGTFANDWLKIPSTQQAVWLRSGEYYRFRDGKIAECKIIIDILDLLRQAGFRFIPALAPEIIQPGPSTFDGILLGDAYDEAESRQSYQLMYDMVEIGLMNDYHSGGVEAMGMERFWRRDMMWYGPCGAGTTRGIDGFMKYHTIPFVGGLPDWRGGESEVMIGEGKYASLMGWPSIHATHTGNTLWGLPATNKRVTMSLMDFYLRDGDLLAENWVYIDMVDFLQQVGVDVFDRLRHRHQYIKA